MRSPHSLLVAMLLTGLVSGCKLPGADRLPYPADPLLLSKKPADEPVEPTARTMLAAAEPTMPPFPTAVAERERGPAAQTVSRRPVPIVPAIRSRPTREGTVLLAHDPDHRWLQGTLEKHHEGGFFLRFAEPTADSPWSGKVRLEDDPRLGHFRDGDLVRVEGGLLPGAAVPRWDAPQRYRLRTIELIRSIG